LNLSSLRTIGSVTSTTRGNSINTGPASSNYIPASAFSALGSPTINDVLERAPDVTIQQMGSQQDRSIVVGGVQPYETQVLIDGHPLALGQFGVWVSTYYPSWLIGGIETQTGPGNTTPFANIAVGGTANLLTPSFTKKATADLTTGIDEYGGSFTHLLTTGSVGHLSYVLGVGVDGENTPLTNTNQCIVAPDSKNPGYATIQYCGAADGNFGQQGEVFKLKYDFTPTTSFAAGFVGAWGEWNPQGTAWGTYYGQKTIEQCQTAASYQCTNPYNANLIGKTITGYGWYTGSSIYNNQTLFDGELRTAIGQTTVLIRPYLGSIEPEVILGAGQTSFPSFFGPVGSYSFPNGTTPPANFAPTTAAEQACAGSNGNLTNPQGQYTVVNGQFQCFGGAYTTYEQDKLYGTTTSIIQPLGGDNLINFTYDFHGQSTYAYINNPAGVSVPFSTDRYSTFSLTGVLKPLDKLAVNFGVYDTTWTVNGLQLADPADTSSTALTSLSRSVTHIDPHLAFVFRPTRNSSIRAAWGTSTTFPFVGQVSGLATYETPAQSLGPPFDGGGTLTEKNPNLAPEHSIAYSLGGDLRLAHDQTVSVDLNQTIIHGVFEQLTTELVLNTPNTIEPGNPTIEGIFFPANVALLNSKSVILKYAYAPRYGFGFNMQAGANSSILSGLTPSVFTPGAASVPANNVQICGNGVAAPGIATCIPYLQGYAQGTYTSKGGTYLALGGLFLGKNNSYFQPPFWQVDFTGRQAFTKNVEFQVAVQNLLNMNNYGAYLPIAGAGTPLVANTTDTHFTSIQQTSFTPTLVPAPPRTVRLSLRLHVGN
jgi:outer membrane receptor protein involved in Fe transport